MELQDKKPNKNDFIAKMHSGTNNLRNYYVKNLKEIDKFQLSN